ncbi:MAG: CRISPR-associated protein, family (Cas_GSU0054) [Acidobacteria bacterium ADurb.Bin051]|jgi:CRISPR-associated protein Csb2|nr:type I-U CRISPR-associated protein Csb2 [Acidobacteriota bacterium]OQC39799.1 MAG: CRISPR-associated protein, family (Cas_GSU0054) [Acidobacteria bacterium ADurb.Bin051]
MLALGTRFLMRRVATTSSADLTQPEWPPHPERLFSALVDAFYGGDGDEAERAALEWLESLPPPEISVPRATRRDPVTVYVPVNDESTPLAKNAKPHAVLGSLPIGRGRKAREFPVVLLGDGPGEDTVIYAWPAAEPSAVHARALARLASRIVRIGHSSSLVQAWVDSGTAFTPTLVPGETGPTLRLRVPAPGRLAALDAAYASGQPPRPGLWAGYALAAPAAESRPEARSLWEDLIVLRGVEGPALTLTTTLRLSEALRGTMLKHGEQPSPEVLSGHRAPGVPAARPHLGYLPLGFVGREHADAHLLGFGLLLPHGLEERERQAVLLALAEALRAGSGRIELRLGTLGRWTLELEDREPPPHTLDRMTYEGPAATWATVTPIVLDRYTKKPAEQEETISRACELIGLPKPEQVVLTRLSPLRGVPPARLFPPCRRRYHLHAVIHWAEPVRGPVVIGAGRYVGYGLMRPWSPA